MKRVDEAFERIYNDLVNDNLTKEEDWRVVFESLKGQNDAETIYNFKNWIEQKDKDFNGKLFKIQEGATGIVYYGKIGEVSAELEAPVYKVVDSMVKGEPSGFGYISSTIAGKLFNDPSFDTVIKEYVSPDLLENDAQVLYNGENGKGYIEGKVMALNDIFSSNYISHLTCSNINTLMSGDYYLNCWGRTEFNAVMANKHINTINGIPKGVFKDIYDNLKSSMDEVTAMSYVCEAIKASQINEIPNQYLQVAEGKGKDGNRTVDKVSFVSKDTDGAIPLIDTMIKNNKLADSQKVSEILELVGEKLKPETRQILGRLAKENLDFVHNWNGFSAQQLALLNTFMYCDSMSFEENKTLGENIGTMKKDMPDAWQKMLSKHPGFLTEKDTELLVNAIQKDPYLRNLEVVNCTRDKGGVNACFVNRKTKEVLFAFPGTNELQWVDSVKGLIEVPSPQQQTATDYITNILEKYKFVEKGYTIDVTGHSTGGNKAQYAALVNPHIRECHSFNGQGFPKEFVEKNNALIAERAGRITSHAADVDYIHCIGQNIAAKQVWYESRLPKSPLVQPLRWAWAHSPGAYLNFKESGAISMRKEVPQSEFAQTINQATRKVMELPKEQQETYFNAIMGASQLAKTKKFLQDKSISPEQREEMQALKKDLRETLDFMEENGFKDKWLRAVEKSWLGAPENTLMAEKTYESNKQSEGAEYSKNAKENAMNKPRRKSSIER